MKYNLDLHYHSPYAAACSKNISIPVLSKEAKLKGLNILTTADILHPIWEKHVKENIIYDENEDVFYYKEDKKIDPQKRTYFILGCEVECTQRVHNLLYFKDWDHLENFKKVILPHSKDIEKYGGGRPRLDLNCKELLELCIKHKVLIGPAHVFTPYFGIYAHYNSFKEAYGKNWKEIKFIELGLSADTNTANTIPELKDLKFFSFSDSHSPASFRIGREYVCCELEKPNFNSIYKLVNNIENKKNKILYNVGYNPYEGKYNKTACRKCSQIYTIEQAILNKWKCVKCQGVLKKGVEDRAKEIAIIQGNKNKTSQINRPEYKYLMPLAQIIQIAINQKNILHKNVLEIYNKFITKYTEIDIMQNVSYQELKKINEKIAKYIISFRNDLVVFKPGGAGHYGVPYVCFSKEEKEKQILKIKNEMKINYLQKTLF
jgi:uncharacterized protein (TIGR00375 family)